MLLRCVLLLVAHPGRIDDGGRVRVEDRTLLRVDHHEVFGCLDLVLAAVWSDGLLVAQYRLARLSSGIRKNEP